MSDQGRLALQDRRAVRGDSTLYESIRRVNEGRRGGQAECLGLTRGFGLALGWVLEVYGGADESFEGGFVDGGVLGDVDGAADVSVEAGVE